MDINIKVTGLEKLAKTVSRSLGGAFEPLYVKRMARAEAEKRKISEQTDREIALMKLDTRAIVAGRLKDLIEKSPGFAQEPEEIQQMVGRTEERVFFQETKRQQNIESITGKAALDLAEKEEIRDDPVDEDWINDFFDNCKDIGDEDMQKIWAKILSGEVAEPGSYSRRTLASVKYMTQFDIKRFEGFCEFIWMFNKIPFIAINSGRNAERLLPNDKASPLAISILQESGLVKQDIEISVKAGNKYHFQYGYNKYLVESSSGAPIKGPCLTFSGMQLTRLVNFSPSEEYRKAVLQMFEKYKFQVTEVQ